MSRIPGEGPIPCDVMLIGEFPGIDEQKYGRPFIGKAGRELRRFFDGDTCPHARDVYLTNLKSSPAGKTYSLPEEDREAIWNEIAMVQPTTIVTLGHHVTQFFLGEHATLEAVHGIPHTANPEPYRVLTTDEYHPLHNIALTKATIFPAYNPAAALHSPKMQSQLAYDLRRLGLYLQGLLAPAPVDERPGTYADASDGRFNLVPVPEIAVDTEGWIHRMWCASYATTPYFGMVVRTGTPGWLGFKTSIEKHRPRVILHNSLHDLAGLRDMGLDLDEADVPFDDTMIMAYLLGLEPQGLKPLAYRHAGARHDDYSDIVAEPNARIAEQWLVDLMLRLPEYTPVKPKKGEPKIPKTSLEHARNLIAAMVVKSEASTVRKRWDVCRAREILVEEEAFLVGDETDPPEATLDEVPLQVAVDYAGRDADLTLRVKRSLRPQIHAMGLDDVYETDLRIVPMVDRMQAVGLGVDVEHFKNLSAMFAVEEAINLDEIERVTGRRFNPRSGDQVAEYIFGELKLHEKTTNLRVKKTRGGARLTTNDKVLEALELIHPSIPLIIEGREIRKMKGTYSDPIPWLVRDDGRLHPRFRLTRAETGRLTAADPNVLALPKHSTRGKLIREGFIAGPGRVLSEWDLSQIEMIVFACDSGDEVMLDAIRSGKDLHVDTAARLLGLDYLDLLTRYKAGEALADEQRFTAKAENFGILMGMTPFGLLDQLHKNGQLHWTLDMTEDLLSDWMKTYLQAAKYIDRKHAEARQYGFVRDMWGRLRWLEGIHSDDKYIREEAERQAQATPTQSGAQGIIKRGMGVLWPMLKEFRRQGMWVECLLQVHDALVFEHEAADLVMIDAAVMHCLTTTVQLAVPIKAKAKTCVLRLGDL